MADTHSTVRLRLFSLRRAVWPILTYVFGCLLRPACRNTSMTPTFDYPVFRYGFLPRHSFRVCCTLHPDLLCQPYCRASFYFPTWAVLFRSHSSPVFISLCTVPPDPFLSDNFLAFFCILVCSTVLCFRPCFQLGTPVSNLAPGVRMVYLV